MPARVRMYVHACVAATSCPVLSCSTASGLHRPFSHMVVRRRACTKRCRKCCDMPPCPLLLVVATSADGCRAQGEGGTGSQADGHGVQAAAGRRQPAGQGARVDVCLCVRVSACMRVCVCVNVSACERMYACVCVRVCKGVCMRACACVHVYVCMCVKVCYACVHVCACAFARARANAVQSMHSTKAACKC